ncbi:MAG: sulfatase-like hydrolase/transferase [Verrucomicrobiota bacterium]
MRSGVLSGRVAASFNFVYFMPDSLRADALACYGHPLAQTPNYDRLAREGTLFERAACQYPVCGPARCSMITGLYPHNTGCRSNQYFIQHPQENLFSYLKQAGYHVEWHGKNDMFAPDVFPHAVSRCNVRPPEFDRRGHDVHDGERIAPIGEPGGRSHLCQPLGEVEDWGDTLRVMSAISFLESRGADAKPFVLYLPLEMPHSPFTAPEPFYSMYDPADVPPLRPYDLPGKPRRLAKLREAFELDRVPDDMLRKIMAVYLGMVSYTDLLLGRLLDALESLGLMDNTVVVALSDHGEYGGDFGLVTKTGTSMEDTHTRVPFIWRGPGIAAGHRVSTPVELFDLTPTSLDLAGVACTHPHFAQSLRPQLGGAPGDANRAAFTEGGLGPKNEHLHAPGTLEGEILKDPENFYYPPARCMAEHPWINARAVMVQTATHKLVRRPADELELYDLVADPQELRNVYDDPAYADVRRELETRIMDWLVETSDLTPATIFPRQGPRQEWA